MVLIYWKNEMKTAKQQAQDLEQTNNFLHSLLKTDTKDEKVPAGQVESTSTRLVNGSAKLARIDPVSRFSDPPAPPPQQPLPEKPDLARSSPSEANSNSSFKRSETARPGSVMGGSPVNPQSSQILSLVEALSSAKKELDSQGARVKHLEDMLRQERSARESAEERARRLEQSASFKPILEAEHVPTESNGSDPASDNISTEHASESTNKQETTEKESHGEGTGPSEDSLQSQLDQMVAEMDLMRQEMQKFQQRAEAAEGSATSTKATLAEMIERLREVREAGSEAKQEEVLPAGSESKLARALKTARQGENNPMLIKSSSKSRSNLPNGHLRTPLRLPEHLERAVATVLRTDSDGQLLGQSAPYASMLGVVLIGVGLMAYLNSWQKMEK
jgi:hypothetical protein